MMATVWIPKSAGHNFSAAGRFGNVRFIFSSSDSHFNPDLIEWRALSVLDEFDPDSDYLLFSGPALLNAIVFHKLVEKHGTIKLLLFHSRENKYLERIYDRRESEQPVE